MTRQLNQLDEYWKAILSQDDDRAAQIESLIASDTGIDELSGAVDVLKQLYETRKALEETRPDRFELPPGSTIGNYEIVNVLGRGGMGIVYRAHQPDLNRWVALKCIHANTRDRSRAVKRFRDEAATIGRLKHPNIVAVHEIGEHEDNWFYTMDLISGGSLSEQLKRNPIHPEKASRLMVDVAGAIHFAHQQKILHRDIKPSNILLDDDGKLYVSDFGLAIDDEINSDESRFTQTGSIIGTPNYLSPEQAMAKSELQSAATDVYGMGATLYEMLCGRPPFVSGNLWTTLRQIVDSDPLAPKAVNPSVPNELNNICLKCLEKQPSRRYPTAEEFQDDLKRYLNGQPVHAQPVTSLNRIAKWCRREPRLAVSLAAIGGLLLSLTTSSMIYSFNITTERDRATEAKQAAIQDRSASVNALERLVDSLYDDLSDETTTIRTREMVVNTAIEGLESLTRSAGDRQADRTGFKAHLRIGDMASLKGSNQLAETHYQNALEVARRLSFEEPDNRQFQRDLAIALSKFGRHMRATGDSRAVKMFNEGEQLLEELMDGDPTDIELFGQLLLLHGEQLELIRLQSPTGPNKIIEYCDALLPILSRAEELQTNDRAFCEAAQKIHFILGRAWLESYQANKADQQFALAEKHIDWLRAAAPNNRNYRADEGVLARARGMAIGAQGHLKRATPYLELAVNVLKELAVYDPDDHQKARDLANSMVILSMARQFAGKRAQAIQLLQDSIAVYQELISTSPSDDNSRALIINARLRIIDIQLLLGHWDEALEQVSLAEQDFAHEFPQMFRQSIASQQSIFKPMAEAVNCLTSEQVPVVSPAGKCHALLWIAYSHASNSSTFSLTPELKQKAVSIDKKFSGNSVGDLLEHVWISCSAEPQLESLHAIFKVRVYGLIAMNSASATQPGESGVNNRAIQKCQAAIRSSAELDPISIRDKIMNEADLIWFREQPGFEGFWKSIIEIADIQK